MGPDPKTLTRARDLRKRMSPPEVYLWSRLKGQRSPDRPVFRRQHPFGPFILDFYCAKARLAVEVDGWMHGTGDEPDYDRRRDAWLYRQGVRVVRYAASEVLKNPDEVARCVMVMAGETTCCPSPSGLAPLGLPPPPPAGEDN